MDCDSEFVETLTYYLVFDSIDVYIFNYQPDSKWKWIIAHFTLAEIFNFERKPIWR